MWNEEFIATVEVSFMQNWYCSGVAWSLVKTTFRLLLFHLIANEEFLCCLWGRISENVSRLFQCCSLPELIKHWSICHKEIMALSKYYFPWDFLISLHFTEQSVGGRDRISSSRTHGNIRTPGQCLIITITICGNRLLSLTSIPSQHTEQTNKDSIAY